MAAAKATEAQDKPAETAKAAETAKPAETQDKPAEPHPAVKAKAEKDKELLQKFMETDPKAPKSYPMIVVNPKTREVRQVHNNAAEIKARLGGGFLSRAAFETAKVESSKK